MSALYISIIFSSELTNSSLSIYYIVVNNISNIYYRNGLSKSIAVLLNKIRLIDKQPYNLIARC